MKKLLTFLPLLSLAANLAAFELPSVKASAITGQAAVEVPAPSRASLSEADMDDGFHPAPPYFHGVTLPLVQDGQAVPGTFEDANKIVIYGSKAEALAAANAAAAAIKASGREIVSVSAKRLNLWSYYASVSFKGRSARIYRWYDESNTPEGGAVQIKNECARFRSMGYTVLETVLKKKGDHYYYFIITAKF